MSSAPAATTDVVYRILENEGTGRIAELRNDRANQIEELQNYYNAIFDPTEASAEQLPLADRALVAVRVASFTRSTAVVDWYAGLAASEEASGEAIERAKDVSAPWVGETALDAAIRHTDLLTSHVSDARASDLQALKDAGLTPAGILSLSQTIAFVSYQLRFIAALRAFGASA